MRNNIETDEVDVEYEEHLRGHEEGPDEAETIRLHIYVLTEAISSYLSEYALKIDKRFKPFKVIHTFEIEGETREIRINLILINLLYKKRLKEIDAQDVGTEIDLSPRFNEIEKMIDRLSHMGEDELLAHALEAKKFFFGL
ncbi:hypothetical protein ACFLZH_00400 [Patescibacteria group bacterium]